VGIGFWVLLPGAEVAPETVESGSPVSPGSTPQAPKHNATTTPIANQFFARYGLFMFPR